MLSRVHPIDVISVCTADGEITPIRFRIETEENGLQRVDIAKVVSRKDIWCYGIESKIYLCKVQEGEYMRMYELRYSIRSHRWSLVCQHF